MSNLNKICTGLFISLLSLSAQAAVHGQPSLGTPEIGTPDQTPGATEMDTSDTRAVVQILHICQEMEDKAINLVRDRNPDEALRRYAEEMTRDNTVADRMLIALAKVKSISLEAAQLESSAQVAAKKMGQEIQELAQRPQGEFRAAFLEAMIIGHERALELYKKIEAENPDDALKAMVGIFRQVSEKHLAKARELKTEAQ